MQGGDYLKKLKNLTISALVLVVLLLTCYSLLPHNSSDYGALSNKILYAGDGIIFPGPKSPPRT